MHGVTSLVSAIHTMKINTLCTQNSVVIFTNDIIVTEPWENLFHKYFRGSTSSSPLLLIEIFLSSYNRNQEKEELSKLINCLTCMKECSLICLRCLWRVETIGNYSNRTYIINTNVRITVLCFCTHQLWWNALQILTSLKINNLQRMQYNLQ